MAALTCMLKGRNKWHALASRVILYVGRPTESLDSSRTAEARRAKSGDEKSLHYTVSATM